MPSSYTTSLRLTLPATGELSGQWGTTVNTGITELLDSAVAGTAAISTWGGAGVAYTLSNNSGLADEARKIFIVATGSPGEAKNVICPAVSKFYVFRNDTAGGFALTLKTGGGTGISVPAGQYKFLYCNGTDVVEMFNSAGALTLSGALSVGGTTTLASNPTLSAGTANQVQYLNASKVLVGSANLTFDGTTLTAANFADSSLTNTRVVYAGASGNLTDSANFTFNGTDLTVSGAVNAGSVNATTLDLTNIEVTNVKAKDGTSAATIADATGVVSFTANPVMSGGTANGVTYLNGSKVVTSGSALTFDGSALYINGGASGIPITLNNNTGSNTNLAFSEGNTAKWYLRNITGNGGFSFYDVNAGSEGMRLTSTGLGIGTSSPVAKLEIYNASVNATFVANTPSTWRVAQVRNNGTANANNAAGIAFVGRDDVQPAGIVGIQSTTGGGVASLAFLTVSGNTTAESMRLDSSGNLGIGVTPSAWASTRRAIQVGGGSANVGYFAGAASNTLFGNNFYFDGTNTRYVNAGAPAQVMVMPNDGSFYWTQYTGNLGAGNIVSTATQAMTLDASGRWLLGTTTAPLANTVRAVINSSTAGGLELVANNSGGMAIVPSSGGGVEFVGFSGAIGSESYTERARITSGGDLLVGTTNSNPVGADINGVALVSNGRTSISRLGGEVLGINRGTDDGTLVSFAQAGSTEGSISVSGGTISYNAFAGSHWSQLQDGSKPDILRGTVMESINELCVWPGENNERLPKSKISDTAGSKKVYGVFMAWDNDWNTTNDMYITAVGAFVCRVNASVTVQQGDLLESNGDGTARVQADDIIRSSTIGKVTSTVKTHQYADGSYCVPTVLYCG